MIHSRLNIKNWTTCFIYTYTYFKRGLLEYKNLTKIVLTITVSLKLLYINFMLYPSHCREGRKHLELRHSVPHYHRILKALRGEWRK